MLMHLALGRLPVIPALLLGGSTVAVGVPKVLGLTRRPTAASGSSGSGRSVLAELAARRLLLADQVAAAKFLTGQPIDDPVRERRILDEVAEAAGNIGLEPAVGMRFFRDQIEANKMVQRGLHSLWRAYPEYGPRQQPDLAREVRPELDRITASMLRELLVAATGGVDRRTNSDPACAPQLDGLHRNALALALRSLPDSPRRPARLGPEDQLPAQAPSSVGRHQAAHRRAGRRAASSSPARGSTAMSSPSALRP